MGAKMNPDKQPVSIIEEALKAVHQQEVDIKVNSAWVNNVMREIRRIGNQATYGYSDPERSGQLVWRFNALAFLLALVLTIYAVSSDLSAASEVPWLFFEDPLAVVMVQSLGLV